jgi:hypothetical protein
MYQWIIKKYDTLAHTSRSVAGSRKYDTSVTFVIYVKKYN